MPFGGSARVAVPFRVRTCGISGLAAPRFFPLTGIPPAIEHDRRVFGPVVPEAGKGVRP